MQILKLNHFGLKFSEKMQRKNFWFKILLDFFMPRRNFRLFIAFFSLWFCYCTKVIKILFQFSVVLKILFVDFYNNFLKKFEFRLWKIETFKRKFAECWFNPMLWFNLVGKYLIAEKVLFEFIIFFIKY